MSEENSSSVLGATQLFSPRELRCGFQEAFVHTRHIIKPNSERWYKTSNQNQSKLAIHRFKFCLSTIAQWPCASYLHLCASVSINSVLVKGRWCTEVGID